MYSGNNSKKFEVSGHFFSGLRSFILVAGLCGLTLYAQGAVNMSAPRKSGNAGFVHPGMLHNQAELDFIKQKVQAEEEPWLSGWKKLLEAEVSSMDWKSGAIADVLRGSYNKPDIGASNLERDASAAYSQSIQWAVTGDRRHALKTIAILNDWAFKLKSIGDHDAKLLVGMTGVNMINAAEIIRHTSSFWKENEIAQFEKMLLDVHYEVIKDYFPAANGNWDASMIQTMLCIGIFMDNEAIFQKAVKYYLEGKGNGAVLHYFNDFGQCQESGRDQSHVQMGIGFLGAACEIAWKQGVDLYGAYDNRLALGFEYTAKYNLGYDVPFETFSSIDGKYKHSSISGRGRGPSCAASSARSECASEPPPAPRLPWRPS